MMDDWQRRLEAAPRFGPTFEGFDYQTPQYQRLSEAQSKIDSFINKENISPAEIEATTKEFKDAFIANRENLQAQLGPSAKPVSESLDRFYQLSPGASQIFRNRGNPDDWRHEIYSHLHPYESGLMPDYRDFQGNILSYKASPITPLNEGLAVWTDRGMARPFNKMEPDSPSNLGNYFKDFVNQVSEDDDVYALPHGNDIWKKQYGAGRDLGKTSEIGALFNEKYIKPATLRYQNLAQAQAPGYTGDIYEDYNGASRALKEQIKGYADLLNYKGKVANLPEQVSNSFIERNMLFSRDPVTMAGQGALDMVRQNPKGVAAGVGLSLLNPETTQALARGDVGSAAGTVAKDAAFGAGTEAGVRLAGAGLQRVAPTVAGVVNPAVAGLAAFAAPALATYGGITGGNEAVRAFTGESVPSKVRQFLGTQERTNRTSPDWQRNTRPNFTIPTVQPMTPQQRVVHQNQQNQNEFQRRLQLAGQRINPAKGEFGLSEMLFGR